MKTRFILVLIFGIYALFSVVIGLGGCSCGNDDDDDDSDCVCTEPPLGVESEENCFAQGDTMPAADGCNTCYCENGDWACTEIACTDDDDDDDNDDNDDDNDDNDDDAGPSTEDCEPYGYDSTPNIIRGPYLQHVTKNTIRILWQTNSPSNSIIRFGTSEDLGYFQCDLESKRYHEVEVEKLSTETEYYYQVRSDGAQSNTNLLSTAPNEDTPFAFVVYGDNRTQPLNHQLVVNGIMTEFPDFVINVGDIIENGWLYGQFDTQFFDQVGALLTTTPIYISIGNHESESAFYYTYFSLPGNERWYSYDYGNSRYIALNSNWPYTQGSAQYTWFEQELQKAQADQVEWLFVFCHHPAYSEGTGGSGGTVNMRTSIVPLMEQYEVDVWFSGHIHDYERGELNGVTHLITGGGGGPLNSWKQDFAHITVYESRYHFVKVEISGKNANFNAMDPDGIIFDTFSLNH